MTDTHGVETVPDDRPDAAPPDPVERPADDPAAPLSIEDLEAGLRDLARLLDDARAVPMSASVLVNRTEVIDLVQGLVERFPTELREARRVVGDREAVLEAARNEADRLLANARAERAALLDRTNVVQVAGDEAERVVAEARAEAERIRRDVDDYVDARLANFEVVLLKTLGAVQRGRNRLNGDDPDRAELAPDGPLDLDAPPT